jgi:SAM-dependent methyltransferase
MAFISTNILPILKEHRLRRFSGHVLCLGHPTVHVTRAQLEGMADLAGVTLAHYANATLPSNTSSATEGCISAENLLMSLGFDALNSLDCSDYEGADILFDLNGPTLPENLTDRFDAIIDHGTIEHVFHIPNALRNIYGMLRNGGRIVHSSPGNNFFDHGFYSFSPTLFFDFYTVNNWTINSLQVYQMDQDREAPSFFADYWPGAFASQRYGGMGDKMYGTICIATKTAKSTGHVCPQQSVYRETRGWQEGAGSAPRSRGGREQ